jgi:hypothetical protein
MLSYIIQVYKHEKQTATDLINPDECEGDKQIEVLALI